MKTKNAEELLIILRQGVAFLKYDYEECVFKIVSVESELKEAWVKFHGEIPYELSIDSKLLYEGMHAMDLITEQEFQDF